MRRSRASFPVTRSRIANASRLVRRDDRVGLREVIKVSQVENVLIGVSFQVFPTLQCSLDVDVGNAIFFRQRVGQDRQVAAEEEIEDPMVDASIADAQLED